MRAVVSATACVVATLVIISRSSEKESRNSCSRQVVNKETNPPTTRPAEHITVNCISNLRYDNNLSGAIMKSQCINSVFCRILYVIYKIGLSEVTRVGVVVCDCPHGLAKVVCE